MHIKYIYSTLNLSRFWGEQLNQALVIPFSNMIDKIFSYALATYLAYFAVVAAIVIFLAIDAADEPERLISAAGILVILLFGFTCSAHPGHVKWRAVIWGVGMEFVLGLLVLRWPVRSWRSKRPCSKHGLCIYQNERLSFSWDSPDVCRN